MPRQTVTLHEVCAPSLWVDTFFKNLIYKIVSQSEIALFITQENKTGKTILALINRGLVMVNTCMQSYHPGHWDWMMPLVQGQ